MIPMIKNVTREGREEYDLYSYEFSRRTVRITGEINDQMSEEVAAKLSYLDSVSREPVTVIINSPGGSVSAGLAVLDTMLLTKSEIHTICTGRAASMGAFLVTCGAKRGNRAITANAEMMIHQPMGGVSGQASDVQLAAAHISEVKRKINRMIASATGQACEKVEKDTDRDYYLSAEEALAYGLVDRIM